MPASTLGSTRGPLLTSSFQARAASSLPVPSRPTFLMRARSTETSGSFGSAGAAPRARHAAIRPGKHLRIALVLLERDNEITSLIVGTRGKGVHPGRRCHGAA